jgi:hypothetical protein
MATTSLRRPERALQHALNFGDTDAFPLPFEGRAIHLSSEEVTR